MIHRGNAIGIHGAEGTMTEQRPAVQVLDCSGGEIRLNGHGEPLEPRQPAVWLTIYKGDPEVNSAGERFVPGIDWEHWRPTESVN